MGKSAHTRSSRTRRGVMRGVLVLASVGLVLALSELALRAVADLPWYERIEDQAAHGQIPALAVGSKRFKLRQGLSTEWVRDANAQRILFLGNSFTYGSGVEDARAVFPALVAERLQALEPESSRRRFEFFNGGIPGSLTRRWVHLYEQVAEPLDPDTVVVVFFLRDGAVGLGSRTNLREIRETLRRLRRESFLFANSYLFRELFEKRIQREVSRSYLEAMERAYLGGAEATEEWRNAQANLLTLRDAARARGSDFVLVIFPVLYGLDDDYPLAAVVDEIRSFAEANGIETLSLLPAFEGETDSDLWVSATDQHPNKRGHAIAAEAIVDFLHPRSKAR